MIVVNLSDGRTLRFELSDPIRSKQWNEAQSEPWFQAQITAIGVLRNGTLHMLPTPTRFQSVVYKVEPIMDGETLIAERVKCQADDVLSSLTVYVTNGSPVRYDLTRIGRQRFDPQTARR